MRSREYIVDEAQAGPVGYILNDKADNSGGLVLNQMFESVQQIEGFVADGGTLRQADSIFVQAQRNGI